MGSDFEINTSEKILFIEDVGEAPYRIDRYLQELKLARKFESITGAILGQFTRRSHEPQDDINDFKIEEVLEHYFADLKIPVIKNFPAGFGFEREHIKLSKNLINSFDFDKFDLIIDNQTRLINSLVYKKIPHKSYVSPCINYFLSNPFFDELDFLDI